MVTVRSCNSLRLRSQPDPFDFFHSIMSLSLFYQKPVIIDRVIHRQSRFKPQSGGFRFAAATNSVPATSVEFALLCQDYPIVFTIDDQGSGVPLALTGLRNAENLFVNQDGKWDCRYVPAFVRQYPFISQLGTTPGEFSLMIDTEAPGFDAADGEPLFNPDGSNSALLDNAVDMLNQYNSAANLTLGFVAKLRELDLLVPREIKLQTQMGNSVQMGGFFVVDEARLAALDDAGVLSLTRSGYLFGIYAHLISLSNIQKLITRLEQNGLA